MLLKAATVFANVIRSVPFALGCLARVLSVPIIRSSASVVVVIVVIVVIVIIVIIVVNRV